jgi:hypothetical protein
MKVLFNDTVNGGRRIIDCELIKERARTITVKLPDGRIVVRKKGRDLPTISTEESK